MQRDNQKNSYDLGIWEGDDRSVTSEFSVSDYWRRVWNDIKFRWSSQSWPEFEPGVPIHLLGLKYILQKDINDDLKEFVMDFGSRIWFSYRKDFPALCEGYGDNVENDHTVKESGHQRTQSQTASPIANGISNERSRKPDDREPFDAEPDASDDELVVPSIPLDKTFSADLTDEGVDAACSAPSSNPSLSPRNTRRFHQNFKRMLNLNFTKVSSSRANAKKHRAPQVPLSKQTSDCGWGCTLRAGQMLLAQALVMHLLGRGWRMRLASVLGEVSPEEAIHRNIICWFNDSWSSESPLSLHRLVQSSSCHPGTWFGPATVCSCIVKVMAEATSSVPCLSNMHVYYARDRAIFKKEILELVDGVQPGKSDSVYFTEHTKSYMGRCSSPKSHRSLSTLSPSPAVLLLIPFLFGLGKHIDPAYIPMLCRLFEEPTFIGLIGGKPNHAFYAVGCQGHQLIYLDPHTSQTAVDTDAVAASNFSLKSWHCFSPKLAAANCLDPSCAIGFYCHNKIELEELLNRLPGLLPQEIVSPPTTGPRQASERDPRSCCTSSLVEVIKSV